jgi:PhoH-like ATPase
LYKGEIFLNHYKGFRVVEDNELAMHYENETANILNFKPNEFIITSNDDLLKYKNKLLRNAGKRTLERNYMGKINAKNREQEMALELLLDNDVKCVVLVGEAGCGKTFLTAQSAIYNIEQKYYSKIFFTRNHIEMGKSIGALPGTSFEKIKPYLSSLVDQVSGWCIMQDLLDRKIIEVEAMSFLQGRDFKDTFIIVDEAQNLDKKMIKMLVTRVGEGSKIVLCGDIQQIVNKEFENGNNGLEHLIDNFTGQTELFGLIELCESVRSPLAKLAAKLL